MINSYIAIDLETTGLDPKKDKIIEIGAIKVLEGVVRDTFSTLIQPGRQLEQKITQLTGITDSMLEFAPEMKTVLEQVIDFCKDLPLLGHHIIFDYSFLKRAAVNQDFMFEKNGIDTLKLCRLVMPEGEKKSLVSACHYFQIESKEAHRALSDAYAAHYLYQILLRNYGSIKKEAFLEKPLLYKVKKEQPATKRQKERLQELTKYHKINLTVQIDSLTRNEISRITDQIISQYGRK